MGTRILLLNYIGCAGMFFFLFLLVGCDEGDRADTSEAAQEDNEPASELNGKYTPNEDPTPIQKAAGFLHVEGNRLLDDAGNEARLTGVNWFGFETSNLSPHGLWERDYRSMLKQIHDMGFNTVRLPWCNAMMRDDAKTSSINTYGTDSYDGFDPVNEGLEGKSPLEVLDAMIDAAGQLGLKVMLDNHSRNPDGYMVETVWYTDDFSESQWVDDWITMAKRYQGNPTVIAFDLNNEPHGEATWGAGVEGTDWNKAAQRCANAIQQVNPDALIVIEGVEKVGGDSYWWGGNLSGVKNHPIEILVQDKLVYSPHEYGPEVFAQPWFTTSSFPQNMASIWDAHFGFIMNQEMGHLFVGEFGIRDVTSDDGRAGEWFSTFMEYMGGSYSWTFWSLNPNSGDTEGILQYDWLTPHQWKLDALTPYLAPMID